MKKRGLLITIFSLAIVMLAGITCFGLKDKVSTNVAAERPSATQSSTAGLLDLGDKWDINLKYSPDNTYATAGEVIQQVYEYEFSNGLSKDLLIKLISEPALDNMTVSFAYSTSKVNDYTTLTGGKYEDKIIPGGTNQYVYLIATVSDTTQIATYGDSIEWQMGTPVTLTYKLTNGSTATGYAVMGAPTQSLVPPEVNESTFVGWYTDSNYTTPATFPYSFTTGQTLYAKYSSPYLPSDWLAWDSTTSSYYVQKGTSTLPEELKIQSTYNDGTHGTANVTYIARGTNASTGVFYTQRSILKSVTLPDTLTSIGADAFFYCTSLTSITIPASVISIGADAFSYCTSLTSITIPASVISIGADAFYKCSSLTSVTFEGLDGYTWYITSNSSYTGGTAITADLSNTSVAAACLKSIDYSDKYWYKEKIVYTYDSSVGGYVVNGAALSGDVTISSTYDDGSNGSNSVVIQESAFEGNTNITGVVIEDGFTEIGANAFKDCTNLETVSITADLASNGDFIIDENAFNGCSNLTRLEFNLTTSRHSPYVQIMLGNFAGCDSLEEVIFNLDDDGYSIYCVYGSEEITFYINECTTAEIAEYFKTYTDDIWYCYIDLA